MNDIKSKGITTFADRTFAYPTFCNRNFCRPNFYRRTGAKRANKKLGRSRPPPRPQVLNPTAKVGSVQNKNPICNRRNTIKKNSNFSKIKYLFENREIRIRLIF